MDAAQANAYSRRIIFLSQEKEGILKDKNHAE